MAEPIPFLLYSSLLQKFFILVDFNCHDPLSDSRGTSDLRREEVLDWVISFDLLPLNDPDTPTLLHRSFPDISFAPSALAFSCSWEVLQDLGSDHLPILLSIPLSSANCPNERPPSFNFQKARWDDFVSYFNSHCPFAEEYSSLSLSSAAALFTSLALNAAKSSISFGRIKRHPKAWWSTEVEETVSERRKAFAAAHRSDEDRQAYISASGRALSVIAKAKAEAWQTTCSSLSPTSNPKSVHSLLRSIAGSPSSSSSFPNFPNCSSPREFALLSLPLNFLQLPQTSPRPLPLAQTKLPIPCYSTFFALAWIFFFTSSIFPDHRIPFLQSRKTSLLFPCIKSKSLSTLLLPSGLSLSPPASQSYLNASFGSVYSSFRNLIPYSLPARPVSALVGLHSIKFCTFLSPFRMSLTNPDRVSDDPVYY